MIPMSTNRTATHRPNRYAGVCVTCGRHVAAQAGYLVGKSHRAATWEIAHLPGDCPRTDPVVHLILDDGYGFENDDNAAEAWLADQDAAMDAMVAESERIDAARAAADKAAIDDLAAATRPVSYTEVVARALRLYARDESLSAAERIAVDKLLADADSREPWVVYYP